MVGDLLASVLALLAFTIFFLPPGYLLASLLQIAAFRTKSLPEKLLWSVSLSTPFSILLAVQMGRHLSPSIADAAVYGLAAAFVLLVLAQALRGRFLRAGEWDRTTSYTALLMACLAAYCILATVGVQVGNRLFEGVTSGDWSVRVPLVDAAIHSRGLPSNPFYGIDGKSSPLRYYYYWYVLCGQLGRMFPLGPRAILTASSAWSGLALFSTIFLYFKYLFRPEGKEDIFSLRRICLFSLPVSCILGLDVLPAVIGLFLHPVIVYPEMEWWRASSDFSPSFHTIILYGPHHGAGLVCCMIGFLVLTFRATGFVDEERAWLRPVLYGVVAGCCFAAAVGTSTYITLFFFVACALLAVERCMARDWLSVMSIALSGCVALGLSIGFIHEITSNAGASVGVGTTVSHGNRFLALFPRNWRFSYFVLTLLETRSGHGSLPSWLELVLRFLFWIAAFVIEIGFFGFVLACRIMEDWKSRRALSVARRFQWILCASFGVLGLCVTSAPLIGVNDLGRHAGFALRCVAILWATPLVARMLWSRERWPLMQHPWLRRAVVATIFLGLATQLWQVVIQRTYFMFVDAGYLGARPPFPYIQHISSHYFDMRQAFTELNNKVPADAVIQYNPLSPYKALMTIYLTRRVAAGDLECMTPFGGSQQDCYAAMPAIQALFGGSIMRNHLSPFVADGITAEAFAAVCRQHHLTAVVATAADRAWVEKTSWVWTQPLLYGNASTRILSCPASPLSAEVRRPADPVAATSSILRAP